MFCPAHKQVKSDCMRIRCSIRSLNCERKKKHWTGEMMNYCKSAQCKFINKSGVWPCEIQLNTFDTPSGCVKGNWMHLVWECPHDNTQEISTRINPVLHKTCFCFSKLLKRSECFSTMWERDVVLSIMHWCNFLTEIWRKWNSFRWTHMWVNHIQGTRQSSVRSFLRKRNRNYLSIWEITEITFFMW